MKRDKESGFVFVFFSFALLVIILAAAFAVDLSRARDEQRRIQYASDSAAIAGAYYVGYSADNVVSTQARAAGSANSLSNSELFSVQCGRWIRGTECTQNLCRAFVQCGSGGAPCTDCADPQANAVRVQSRRAVNNSFARIVGQNTITPNVHSISLAVSNSDKRCVKPLGVVSAYLTGLGSGDTFTIRKNAPGNWGKIDIGGVNYSSGNNFSDAIAGPGACSEDVYVGAPVASSTGNGGSIDHALDDAITAGTNLGWILPVISQQSNGQNMVTMLEFIQVDLVSTQGNGNGWNATFRLVARGVDPGLPPPSAGEQDRFLVQ